MIKITEVQVGDVFSEKSYYQVESINTDSIDMKMVGTDKIVTLGKTYVQDFLRTADQYQTEVKVGLEDKFWTAKQIADETIKGVDMSKVKVGDLKVKGIRSLWEEIYSQHVFTVCYLKQPKVLSDKAYNEKVQQKAKEISEKILSAKTSKKSMSDVAIAELETLIKSPILKTEDQDARVLRGYKVQFSSRDGRYDCIDMDIDSLKTSDKIRPVNILTIQWLVFDGVKYICENK